MFTPQIYWSIGAVRNKQIVLSVACVFSSREIVANLMLWPAKSLKAPVDDCALGPETYSRQHRQSWFSHVLGSYRILRSQLRCLGSPRPHASLPLTAYRFSTFDSRLVQFGQTRGEFAILRSGEIGTRRKASPGTPSQIKQYDKLPCQPDQWYVVGAHLGVGSQWRGNKVRMQAWAGTLPKTAALLVPPRQLAPVRRGYMVTSHES
jgi:hypothetical protein